METDSKTQQGLYKLVTYSTAVALGVMVASLEALRPTPSGFSFQISFRTLIAFVLGGAVAFPFWRFIFNGASWSNKRLTFAWICFLALLLALGVGAFLYPLRYVPREKLPDILIGLLAAVLALSAIGFLLWRVKRFLDRDSNREKL
ncbi:hypothetical protein [Pedosphaera parvula]|uniref:Uncharacterized protein n=1 Tax=Pedosphaera parvula (strain Ellin514) TaxID=320771 RepID=B9XP43_PEDPL|nr:hypothetical protein [Pedosphaera parvula]EEF58399.1 hypothetical protein Cflav_PD6142 [Pedosphaera parvula Ellin514]